MKVVAALFVGGLAVSLVQGQASSPPDKQTSSAAEVVFDFERPGLSVPKFTLTVREDGTGSYKGEMAAVSAGSGSNGGPRGAGQPINQTVLLSASTAENIFKTARSLDYFNIACASKAKNIADTGKKVLSYSGPDGHGSCTYNYSENKNVTQLTETFQAIAFTMDEGRKLDFMHRYDRLGLYSEMDVLKRELEAKRALELVNISPSLTSIANDEALMERVRERAVALLNVAGAPPKQP